MLSARFQRAFSLRADAAADIRSTGGTPMTARLAALAATATVALALAGGAQAADWSSGHATARTAAAAPNPFLSRGVRPNPWKVVRATPHPWKVIRTAAH